MRRQISQGHQIKTEQCKHHNIMMSYYCKVSAFLLLHLVLVLRAGSSIITAEQSESAAAAGQSHVHVRRTATAAAQDICQPHHIHLSVGRLQNRTHSSMTVSFSISSACVGKKRHKNKSFGAVRLIGGDGEGGEDDFLVIGDGNSTKEYDAMSPRRSVERYYSDLYYHIEINDLRPDREYSYECLLLKKDAVYSMQYYLREDRTMTLYHDDNVIARSGISSFTTPPAPGQWHSSGRTVKFAVIGDLAAREHSRKTISHLDFHSESVDAILFAGDLAYPSKDHVNWDSWMNLMSRSNFFSAIPIQITLGNHDLDTYKHGWVYDINESVDIALAYENRFHMPQIRPPIRELASMKGFTSEGQPKDFITYEYGNAYYSFTFGPSKHIVLSSFSNFREGSLQYEWLLSELKSVDRSITPWLIVMLHCPLYNTFKSHRSEIFTTEARAILEPLFVEYTVNFVISGHVHAYMCTKPVAFSQCNPRGPIHIIQGNGGRRKSACEPYHNETAEEWVAVREQSQYGYGTLELFNNSHAMWRLIKTGQDENGEVDEIWVSNQLDEMNVNRGWEDNY